MGQDLQDFHKRSHLVKNFNLTCIYSRIRLPIMGITETIGEQREQILSIAAKYGAFHVRVFGSVAHGTADKDSDIDFLVEMEKGRSLFDLGGLLIELQELLNRQVDVVTPAGLKARIRDRVLKEAVLL